MRRIVWALAISAMVFSACGSDGSSDSTAADQTLGDGGADGGEATPSDDSGDSGGSNAVDDPAPPGEAEVSVDGLDLSFELPGALDCSISDEAITFAYRIGDNEITLGGGVNRVDGGWMGSIALSVANPDGELGPIGYYPAPGENGIMDESLFAIDGDSMTYSGPMVKQPANDGSLPPPVDVGNGMVSATCG